MLRRSFAVVSFASFVAAGCGGSDDVSGAPLEDTSSLEAGEDTELPDTTTIDSSVDDTAVLDSSIADSGVDTTLADTNVEDTLVADTGSPDTGTIDTGTLDTGVLDTGPLDTGVLDTGPLDTGVLDTGVLDTGPLDTGAPDTRPPDTGPADTGPLDTGAPDTGPLACTGEGFAATGTSFGLPTMYPGAWFYELYGSTSCGSSYSRPSYQVFDIDGDALPDLVVTNTCTSGTDIGRARWVVHKNTGSGFSPTGVDWALPTSYTGAWYYELDGSTSCGSSYSRPSYHVFDIDGDGLRDLVVTNTCASGTDVGRARWVIHRNTGSGFASTGVDWALPTSYTGAWYYDLSGSTSCGSSYSRPSYQVFDIDGDRKLDLVVTNTCTSGTDIGRSRWVVHKNSGTAFASTGVDWALPTSYTGAWYYELDGSTSCGSSYSRPSYHVFDLGGDGRPDLVVTNTCTSGTDIGRTRWVVHPNTGAAFAGTGVDWALPTAYMGAWYYELAGSTSCGSSYSRPSYQVVDLDGDGKRDLVMTNTCASGTPVGREHWLLHRNTGTGFAASSSTWCLPNAYRGAWFYDLTGSTSCGSSYSRPSYHVFDLNGDRKLELVVTNTCDSGTTVGRSQWLVH